MAILRSPDEQNLKLYGKHVPIWPDEYTEWSTDEQEHRIDEPTWIQRYKYESDIIVDQISKDSKAKV